MPSTSNQGMDREDRVRPRSNRGKGGGGRGGGGGEEEVRRRSDKQQQQQQQQHQARSGGGGGGPGHHYAKRHKYEDAETTRALLLSKILRALLARSMFVVHSLITIWQTVEVYQDQ